MSFDPFTGYSIASGVPDYYNPYKSLTSEHQSQLMAQREAQRVVPGRDAATPGSISSTAGAGGRKVKLVSPRGSMREVPEEHVNYWVSKGARRI